MGQADRSDSQRGAQIVLAVVVRRQIVAGPTR
jgi:hypothetical protein